MRWNPLSLEQERHLREMLQGEQLDQYTDSVLPLAQNCIYLHEESEAADGRHGTTRFGGIPDVPQDFRWPSLVWKNGETSPLLFVAQIRLAEVATYDQNTLLPPSGMLSFFIGDQESGSAPCAVIHVAEEACGNLQPYDISSWNTASRVSIYGIHAYDHLPGYTATCVQGISFPVDLAGRMGISWEDRWGENFRRLEGWIDHLAADEQATSHWLLGYHDDGDTADEEITLLDTLPDDLLEQYLPEKELWQGRVVRVREASRSWNSRDTSWHEAQKPIADGEAWRLLLRVSSQAFGSGPAYFLIKEKDLQRGNFSRVVAILAQW